MFRIIEGVFLVLLLGVSSTFAQSTDDMVHQRLASTIGILIVENARLAAELEAANKMIAQLKAEVEKANDKK